MEALSKVLGDSSPIPKFFITLRHLTCIARVGKALIEFDQIYD